MIWEFIVENLTKDKKVMLLTVITHTGSSPGKTGFQMAVTACGKLHGSIGGGIMEHRMVELAKTTLQQTFVKKPFIRRLLHDTSGKDGSGLLCSGAQTIAFVTFTLEDLPLITEILHAKQGTVIIDQDGCHFSPSPPAVRYACHITSDNRFRYSEWLNYRNHLYIIGGGHVSLALSKVMRDLDFYITVFDNRHELTTLEANTFAHEKHIIRYNRLDEWIPDGKNIYIAIMTFSHKSDETALRKLIDKEVAYIGMLGSEKKIGVILHNLGITHPPAHFFAPIGLIGHCTTPSEIAVSVAAEILAL